MPGVILLVEDLDSNALSLSLSCVSFTPESLVSFPRGSHVLTLFKELRDLIYDRPTHGNLPAIRLFYHLDGLIKNYHSDGVIPDNSPDRSYNFATTIGNGKGQGKF